MPWRVHPLHNLFRTSPGAAQIKRYGSSYSDYSPAEGVLETNLHSDNCARFPKGNKLSLYPSPNGLKTPRLMRRLPGVFFSFSSLSLTVVGLSQMQNIPPSAQEEVSGLKR